MFEVWRRRTIRDLAEDDDTAAVATLLAAALAPVAPIPAFEAALRVRLVEAAATEQSRRMFTEQHRSALQRRVLVGAGAAAAVSLAGAALAVWRRNQLEALLHAKSA